MTRKEDEVNLMKCYWQVFRIFVFELFFISLIVLVSGCASVQTAKTEGNGTEASNSQGIDVDDYKGVSNIEVMEFVLQRDGSADVTLCTFEVPYERLPVRDKSIIDANDWYKEGDMVTIKFQSKTHESWIYTPSRQWHKVK